MSDSPDERAFEEAADRALRALDKALNELADGPEVDLESGILTLEFADGAKYVINSHRAARQIWMAAESNAWHFDERGGKWIASKSGDELWAAISAVVGRKLGHAIALG